MVYCPVTKLNSTPLKPIMAQKTITSKVLSSKAVLVQIAICRPSFRKGDKDADTVVESEFHCNSDSGKFMKNTINPAHLAPLKAAEGKIRAFYIKNSVPWMDGVRLIGSAAYDGFLLKLRELQSEWDMERRNFLKRLPEYITEGKQALGGLGKDEDYGDPEDIAKKFSIKYNVFPVPDKSDIRVELSAAGAAEIEASCENKAAEVANSVIEITRKSLTETLGAITKKLAEPKKAGKKGEPKEGEFAIFRDSLIGNVMELAQLIKTLNILDDPEVTKVANSLIESFGTVDPDAIRENADTRKEVAAKAESTLSDALAALADIGYGSAA